MSAVGQLEELIRRIVREELTSSTCARSPEQLVTVAAYAAARSISESTVRAAMREGRLPSKKIGRAVRVPASAEIARHRTTADERDARADRVLGIGGRP